MSNLAAVPGKRSLLASHSRQMDACAVQQLTLAEVHADPYLLDKFIAQGLTIELTDGKAPVATVMPRPVLPVPVILDKEGFLREHRARMSAIWGDEVLSEDQAAVAWNRIRAERTHLPSEE